MPPTTLADRVRVLLPDSSERRRREVLRTGRVLVNGAPVRDGRVALRPEDRVTLGPRPPRPLSPSLRLVHEDDHVLVIEKPPGLLTIATASERGRTAYRLVWDYLAGHRPPRRPFVVHRLDRDTSGLVVLAKSVAAKRHLQAQFAGRNAERRYLALVEGDVSPETGTLTSQLDEDSSLKVRSVGPGRGREAVTHYRVVGRRPGATLLEILLGTGRRRQIRVQLADLGHPILGDQEQGSRRRPGRLALHATRLGFVHPATGRPVTFDSPPPPLFGSVSDPGGAPRRDGPGGERRWPTATPPAGGDRVPARPAGGRPEPRSSPRGDRRGFAAGPGGPPARRPTSGGRRAATPGGPGGARPPSGGPSRRGSRGRPGPRPPSGGGPGRPRPPAR
jgi:23S rRNA pseudouridine1911/1915/1917 synthase